MSDAARYSIYHGYGRLAQAIADHLQSLGFLDPSVKKWVIKRAIQTEIDRSDIGEYKENGSEETPLPQGPSH